MCTRIIFNCEKTFSALTSLGAALFINLPLNFWYFASLFVIPRMFLSLTEKLWAALKRVFFTPAAFVSSNILLAILRTSNLLSTWTRIEKKLINKTSSSLKHSTVVSPTFPKLPKIKLNKIIEP